VAVLGIGATGLPVPVSLVYHKSLLPVAVKAAAVDPLQYVIGDVTVGAIGIA